MTTFAEAYQKVHEAHRLLAEAQVELIQLKGDPNMVIELNEACDLLEHWL